MQRRLWLLAGVGAAVLMIAASATATTKVAGSAKSSSLAAAPFAQSWANVPRTPAARKAKSVLVFGAEQDITGFNVLDADENALWAQVTGISPTMRGTYIVDNQGNYHLDLASKVTATKTNLTITIRPDANWNWGGKKLPVTNKDLVYTWQQIVDPNNNNASTTGYDQIDSYKLVGSKTVVFHWKKPFADYRDLFGLVLSLRGARRAGLQQVLVRLRLRQRRQAGLRRPVHADELHARPGLDPDGEPRLVRHEAGPEGARLQGHHGHQLRDPGHARRRGRRDLSVAPDRTRPAQGPGRADLQLDPRLHAGARRHPGWPEGQPAAQAAVDAAGDHPRHEPALADRGALRPDRTGPQAAEQPEYELGHERDPALRQVGNGAEEGARPSEGALHRRPDQVPTRNNTAIWTCNGQKAEFRWYTTAGNQRRATSAAIFSQQLGAIGIKLDVNFEPANPNFFGHAAAGRRLRPGRVRLVGRPGSVGLRRHLPDRWRLELQAVQQQAGRRPDQRGRRRA